MNKMTFDWNEYGVLAREAVAEGIVLLNNEDQALPIQQNETVSVFGRIQLDYYKSGTGSGGMVNAPYVVSILDGLKNCRDINLNMNLLATYQEWVKDHPFDTGVGWAMEPWCQEEMPLSEEMVEQAAKNSDLALVVIGRSAGEDKDAVAQKGSYLLTDLEEDMLQKVCQKFKRTVVLLNVGSIIDMHFVTKYQPQAVLYCWQGGMEGGNGIADVLTGKVSPSGKLADTIAYEIGDYPSTNDFGDEVENEYREDIYVGYRYFETIAKEKVQYPFGYGLSYTTFSYRVTKFNVDGLGSQQKITLEAAVKNTGACSGKESLQVYYCPPQGALLKPFRNLIAFEKTESLEPGQIEKLCFEIKIKDMASYDDGGNTGHAFSYVLEKGKYSIYIGTNVREAVLAGEVMLTELEVVEELTQACAPVKAFDRMVIDGDQISYEAVPVRNIDLAQRITDDRPESLPYEGDHGYLLKDVYDQKVSIQDFLSQLSDEDLICMTRGEGMCSPKVTPGIAGSFGGVTDRLKDFGIPIGGCADGPSGIRMDCGTMAFSLPNGTLLACTYNKNLVTRLYEMEGKELLKNQIDSLLGPGINIHRNPLNGRNFEYFSEDPYLTGAMAVAELKGMHRYGVTGTIKHFACNNQETARHDADAIVSERALREIYLKAYEMCVKEADAYSIMSTYGPLNGIYTAGNYDLLTTILRKEWGYAGIVMTDWWAKINEEGKEGYRENTPPMIRAQNDVYMCNGDAGSNSNHDESEEGLVRGTITRGELLRNAANICRVIMRSPVMDRYLQRNLITWDEKNRPAEKGGKLCIMERVDLLNRDAFTEKKLSLTNLCTEAGTDVQYAVNIPQRGKYLLRMKLKSELGGVSQMNLTISLNKTIIETIAMTGASGEWIEKTTTFEVFVAVENYLDFYFGQTGIDVGELTISPIE